MRTWHAQEKEETRQRPERLAERAKMIGTREKRGGLKRISAAIAAAADFQTMRRASERAGERSDRVSRGGLVDENRDIEVRERREEKILGAQKNKKAGAQKRA